MGVVVVRTRHVHLIVLVSGVAVALCATPSAAIAQRAEVTGVVTDAASAVLPGVSITLRDENMQVVRSTTTDGQGAFSLPGVPPGVYQLGAELDGFAPYSLDRLILNIDAAPMLTIRLAIQKLNETVSVVASPSPLRTRDASIGSPFEGDRILALPLNARNLVGLLSLQPGVTRSGEVNGGRRDQANITLDGVDINDQGVDPVSVATRTARTPVPDAFAGVLRVTPDSVQEFRVTTANPDASAGRSSGAQIALVTRSGTNELRGAAYLFNRNTRFSANEYFNEAAGLPTPKLDRNVFGGALGGPVVRNRLFFFGNYEGRRDSSEQSVLRTVPSDSLRQGEVRYRNLSGGTSTLGTPDLARLFPVTGGANPAVLAALRAAPAANDPGAGDGLNFGGYRFNAPTAVRLNTNILRFDVNAAAAHRLFVRGNYQADTYEQPPQFLTTAAPNVEGRPWGLVLGHDWVVNRRMVSNTRVGVTRQEFVQLGDTQGNALRFSTYRPTLERGSVSRTTPVYTFANDTYLTRGNHTWQFGGQIRLIRSDIRSDTRSFDLLSTNFAFYPSSGAVLTAPLDDISASALTATRGALAVVLGRLTQYTANGLYGADGQLLARRSTAERSYATEEYEPYVQDSWRLRPSLTLGAGLRWTLSRPVYERNGLQAQPTVNLGQVLDARIDGARRGVPYNAVIGIDRSGPANDRPSAYHMDWNNLAPSVSLAWTPDFGEGALGGWLGRKDRTVIRGGFRMLYDRIGSTLVGTGDLTNALGFSTSSSAAPGSFNLTTLIPPPFTGSDQDARGLPQVVLPATLTYPRGYPADESARSENSIDDSLTTPVHYTWNVSYGRALTEGLSFELSYVGRKGRNLLAARDVLTPVNLTDPASGQTWYTAAGTLGQLHDDGLALSATGFNRAVPVLPFFENLYPGDRVQRAAEAFFGRSLPFLQGLSPSQQAAALVARGTGLNATNWVAFQRLLDDYSVLGRNVFVHPQYASLTAFSTIGYSDYHGVSGSLRGRYRQQLLFDVNYTWGRANDTGSTLEGTGDAPNVSGLILNPFNVAGSYGSADYDVRHNLNANVVWSVPVGEGQRFLATLPTAADVLLGGWQIAAIARVQSGLPVNVTEGGRNSLSFGQFSRGVLMREVLTDTTTAGGTANMFADPIAAYQSFRNARPGEEGTRNALRLPGYAVLDMAFSKRVTLPYGRRHSIEFRWEIFNLTNTQPFGIVESLVLDQDPYAGQPPAAFGRFVGTQTPVGETRAARMMQFALRYAF
jgi:hypothetical protein